MPCCGSGTDLDAPRHICCMLFQFPISLHEDKIWMAQVRTEQEKQVESDAIVSKFLWWYNVIIINVAASVLLTLLAWKK